MKQSRVTYKVGHHLETQGHRGSLLRFYIRTTDDAGSEADLKRSLYPHVNVQDEARKGSLREGERRMDGRREVKSTWW